LREGLRKRRCPLPLFSLRKREADPWVVVAPGFPTFGKKEKKGGKDRRLPDRLVKAGRKKKKNKAL